MEQNSDLENAGTGIFLIQLLFTKVNLSQNFHRSVGEIIDT